MDSGGQRPKPHFCGRLDVKTIIVKDLMVPLEEYATVHEGATLYEAVLALEKA